MTISLVFLAVLMLVFGGWLFSHSINVRPWEAQSEATPAEGITNRASHLPLYFTAARVGLVVFLAVVTAVFALTISAYLMRMEMGPDWRPLPTPGLLWLNTASLVLGSVALQRAWAAAKKGNDQVLRRCLMLGGGLTIAFILGQGVVWWQLHDAGYYLAGNPANAFFFLMTALHALHLLGGLVAWGRTLRKVQRGASAVEVRASVELCALYWHFLLLVWAILFALVLST
ncbi:cytochrome c oxidase subunit 3 [Halomonas heilongjiangensis]|uniref:Cytochrome oxidase subunit III n=1 Tax=Halomonas heilongjiangensis TaxID=1387883 RepID=A0A2N7TRI6_9GAMM|nr:cytochrome c oxidase subunit 3 [Halomonas heilongjiangensis]PMR70800.1 cytochrome oxidase subunit III [Halomonas heilongjiangensis]PXX94019.1 cytochrome oxidase subunit III [Halomonas heilongjiangensis]